MHAQSPHFNPGRIPLAFVLSAPGAREVASSCPAAGATGTNLETALAYLTKQRPLVFPSGHRYDYRITNAHTLPLARSRGDRRTEATNTEVLTPANVQRLLDELEGCMHVVLCGRRPQLLAPRIRQLNHRVVEVFHTSNQALVAKHNAPSARAGATPGERHNRRAQAWADDLLNKLDEAERDATTVRS